LPQSLGRNTITGMRLVLLAAAIVWASPAAAAGQSPVAWWVWPLALFAVTFALGVVAVLAGVGGGVLFVPIVGAFFPFHLDFVRGAGLLLALAGTLAAGPVVSGQVALEFEEDGTADPADFVLQNEEGVVVRVELARLADEVRIRRE